MHIITQGLVLREVAYKESDKILTVLTREGGKRTVKARNCRKRGSRLAASAQLLVYSDMTLFEYKDFWSLDEADSLEQFRGLREDLDLLSLASYFAEVMEAVAEEGRSDESLLALMLNAMYALDKLKKPAPLVKAVFELKLMALAGYEPLLMECGVCGAAEPKEPCLGLLDGMLSCTACRTGEGTRAHLEGGSLTAMRHVLYGDPRKLFSVGPGAAGMGSMAYACEAFLLTQLDRGFRTLDFYKGLTQIPQSREDV